MMLQLIYKTLTLQPPADCEQFGLSDYSPNAQQNTKASICLQDCLELFSQPEKLTKENAWYV